MRILCSNCLKYHDNTKLCGKIIIECESCHHKQATSNKNIKQLKCSVCNKYKMSVKK